MSKTKTVTDLFAEHDGAKEWDSFVEGMTRWYYGKVAHVPWCAISMSYMMNLLGMIDAIGGKHCNCYYMMEACRRTPKGGRFYFRDDIPKGMTIPRGTIVFILRSKAPMDPGSKKHVTSVDQPFVWRGSGFWLGRGGNQRDQIRVAQYTQAKIYAIFMPPYAGSPSPTPGHPTLRRGSKGENVKELQARLNAVGVKDKNGRMLKTDGHYGPLTEGTVKSFQAKASLTIDGVCGPRTWAALDKATKGLGIYEVTTLLNVRRGPGKNYPVMTTTQEGDWHLSNTSKDDWRYLPDLDGWSKAEYLRKVV